MNAPLEQTAARAGSSDSLRTVARVGFAVNGVVHLLLGWLALQLALGSASAPVDQEGAFATLTASGPGRALLWVCVVGFAGLALWQLTEAVRVGETGDRVKAAAKAVVYAVLAWTAYPFAAASASGGGGGTSDVTASLMSTPWGAPVVGAAGLALVGVGAYHVVKGVTKGFLRDLVSDPGRPAVVAGRVGYVAKGIALGTVGVLFVVAAVTNDPEEAAGLDHALRTLLEAPFGRALLTAVGVGLAAYGVYSFARARHARV